jgi:hypothetical protein
MAASVRKTELGHLDCVSRDSKGSGIFEACARGRKTGKDARLFFFHYEPQRAIVCLNVCWKAKDKGKRQTRAFDDAAELMRDFLEGREGRTTP